MKTIQLGLALAVLLAGSSLISAQTIQPPAPSQRLAAGRAALAKGDFKSAIAKFKQATQAQPANLFAWHFLAQALHASGDPEAALPAYLKAVAHPRVAAVDSYNIACIHSLAGRTAQSLTWIEKAWRAGYRDLAHARKDTDLKNVQSDTLFEKLLTRLAGELIAFQDGTRIIHELPGEKPGDQFGWVAGNAGDVDADGVNDFIVGAPNVRQQGRATGAIYVYSGKTGSLLFKKLGQPGDLLGYGVDGVGDINGDGHADVVAGAPSTQQGGPGKVYVFSGKTGAQLSAVTGAAPGDRTGVEASGVGDLDQDGVKDYLAGASRHDGAAGKDAGQVILYSGKTHQPLATLDGERAGDQFGRAAEGYFDQDHALLVVGAPKAGPNRTGRAYVYKEHDLKPAFTLDADATGGGFGEMFVSIPGDLNGDKTPDIYVSYWRNRANGGSAGRVYLYSGKDGSQIAAFTGQPGEGFGIGKAEAGDVDGDGYADLIVGAWKNSDLAPSAGKAYLISMKTQKRLKTFTCRTNGDTFGFDSTGLGDVNGDGALDFLITSAYSGVKGPQSGRVFVISGKL